MRKSIVLLLLTLLTLTSCLIIAKPAFSSASTGVTENTWVSKAPMQVARANMGVAVVNGDIYAIGGNTISGLYNLDQGFSEGTTGRMVNSNEEYNPVTDNWTLKAPMPTPRDNFAIAVYQGKIYCIGGRQNVQSSISVNEVYDPTTDTWATKSPLLNAQWPLQANVVNGKICVMDHSGNTYAYDPATDSWTTKAKAPLISPFGEVSGWATGFNAVAIDDKIYVVGMIAADTFYGNVNLIYDVATDTWSQAASVPPYSGGGGLFGLGGYGAAGATTGVMAPKRIYFFFDNQTYIYNPTNDSWTFGTALPMNRVNFGVAVINDTFYVIGGGNNPEAFFDAYAPKGINEQYIPVGYGNPDPSYVMEHTPPKIEVQSPLNQRYNDSTVSLTFSIDKPVIWAGYSLDGKQNVTMTSNGTLTCNEAINITLAHMTSGLHNLTVYANDTSGNMGASQGVTFTITKPEAFSTTTIGAVSGAAVVVVVGAGLLVYFKKTRQRT